MSLVKTVEVDIVATAGDAREQLGSILDQARELGKPFSMKLIADTIEAQEQVDDVTDALTKYLDAQKESADAAAHFADVQKDDQASSDEMTAALDRQTQATVRALDAQIRYLEAEEKAAMGAKEEGDSAELAGDKSLKSGEKSEEGAGMMEGAWDKAKLAILGLAGGLVYGIVKAAGFQSQLETLHTQAGVSQASLKSLGSGVLKLAGQVGSDPDSLVGALYHVESSFQSVGITGPKALNLLKIAAEGAATGHANLVDVTNALDATIVAGVHGIHNYSQAMGALNSIVGSGDMTMEDLATAMGSGVMAVAKSFGQSIYQVGAALATLGDNNIRGAKAATDLRMAWQAVLDPIKTGIPMLTKLGLTQDQLGTEMTHHGLTAALQMFVDHLKASKVPASDWGQYMTDIFGKKAGVGIGILTDQLDRLKGKLPDIEHGAASFGNAWTSQTKTVSQQWHDLLAGSEALATSLGEKLLPVALKVVRGLSDFVDGLEHGSAGALALAAVIGTALAGVAMEKLASGIKTVESGFESMWNGGSKLVSWAGTMIGKLTGQAAATDELAGAQDEQAIAARESAAAEGEADVAMDANPIGLIVIAITALIVAIVEVVRHWKDFREWGLDAWHAVRDVALDAWHAIDNDVIQPLERGTDALVQSFGALYHEGVADFDSLKNGIVRVVGDVIGWFERLPRNIVHALSSLGGMLFDAGKAAIEGLLHGMESLVGGVLHTAENWGHDIANALGSAFGMHFSEPSEATLMVKAGRRIAEGLGLGMDDGRSIVSAAAGRLSQAAGLTGASGAYGAAAGGRGGDTYIFQIAPLTDPQKVAREIQQMLLALARTRGFKPNTSAGLGLA